MSYPNRLIVEGPDDRETVLQLCNEHGFNPRERPAFEIEVASGVDAVPRAFRAAVRGSYRAVAAIVDADSPAQASSAADRWRSWRAQLAPLGYPAPADLPMNGLVLDPGDRPRVGVWIMPDNQRDGAMEDWLLNLVPPGDPLMPAARAAVETIAAEVPAGARFADKDRQKAALHTFLACKPITPTPSGLAFTRRYLDAHHPDALRLLAWLRAVFA